MKFFNVDDYLGRSFSLTHYNCWHFVLDVWHDITGEKLWDYTPDKKSKGELQLAARDAAHKFVEVPRSGIVDNQSAFIVLATTPCDSPHVGVLYQGKVLHLRLEGAIYQRLEVFMVGFNEAKFYTTQSRNVVRFYSSR